MARSVHHTVLTTTAPPLLSLAALVSALSTLGGIFLLGACVVHLVSVDVSGFDVSLLLVCTLCPVCSNLVNPTVQRRGGLAVTARRYLHTMPSLFKF